MARISKDEQARIRLLILHVATEKFNTVGFENVSTKEIAKEVGIAEGTLFNYFDSKTHLFLEVFSEQFSLENERTSLRVDVEVNLVDIIMDHITSMMRMMLRLSKPILAELMLASVRMAKKHPKQFRRFVELDFKYMAEMEQFIVELQRHHLLCEVDAKMLSEMIYGIIMYEFVIYLYDKEISKEQMKEKIRSKLHLLLKGYYIGGKNGN